MFRTLGALAEPPGASLQDLADLLELGALPPEDEHTDLFLFQLYPYASVYLGPEGKLGGEARDRVAGFFRALDIQPPPEPDRLAVMLAFYAELAESEADGTGRSAEGARRARRAWLWEHLLSWLPVYLDKLEELASPFYRGWGQVLTEALREAEADLEGDLPLPLHLREAGGLADPREEGAEAFLESLLSPVRSGLLLVGRDLETMARELELGLRKGERRFVLRSLLGQAPSDTLEGLSRKAELWQVRHLRRSLAPTIGRFWSQQAARSAELLEDLARSLPTDGLGVEG